MILERTKKRPILGFEVTPIYDYALRVFVQG